jgi:hypothetical protein
VIYRLDAATGALVGTLPLTGFPPIAPQRFGLAFNPSGNLGAGTFLVTATVANSGIALEFDRAGALLRTALNLPANVGGAGYDPVFGNWYFFSSQPRATPAGPVQVNGFEWSGYDFDPTGVTFFGNLQQPNPGGPRGGVAGGFEVYRRPDGAFRAVCVAHLQTHNVLYELEGPFRFGPSLLGTTGMRGLPFEGSPNFEVRLSGVPNAVFAALYAGFSLRPTPRRRQASSSSPCRCRRSAPASATCRCTSSGSCSTRRHRAGSRRRRGARP